MKRLTSRTSPSRRRSNELQSALKVLFGIVAIFWVVEILDQIVMGGRLDLYGIDPRDAEGLPGIVLAPFLHGGFGHLVSNTVPFLVLGGLLAVRGKSRFIKVSIIIALMTGAAVWLLARDAIHIGASGVVFGYLGYHLAAGYYERSPQAILIAIGVGVLYGGLIWGVLPGQPGISWEGHLFGLGSGVATASMYKPRKSPFAR